MHRTWIVGLLLPLALFNGCGGGDSPQTAENAPKELIDVELEGTWQGQVVVNDSEAAKKLGEQRVAALREIRMEMTFRPDGTLQLAGETAGQPYTSENRWDLVGTDGNKLTIKSVDSQGQEKNVELFFLDSHSFEMPLSTEVADLGAMRFTRLR